MADGGMMLDMTASDSPLAAGWGLWLWWVLASTAGWAAGASVGVAVSPSRDIIVAGFVGVAVGGILAGVLQWLLLRQQIAGADRWVLASIVAAAAVGTLVFGVGMVNRDVGWVAGAGLFGTVAGALQWLVLRGQVPGAGWWVAASTVGWVAGSMGVGFLSWLVGAPVDGPVGGLLGWPALGAVYGAITGAVLVWLLPVTTQP